MLEIKLKEKGADKLMIYSEKQEDQQELLVWTSNPANREIYSYILRLGEGGWEVVSKKRSYKREHPQFGEKTKLEPESTQAVRKHVREEYGIMVES